MKSLRYICVLTFVLASTLSAKMSAKTDSSASIDLLAGIINASDAPPSTGGFYGTVIDAGTKLPVENVKVEVLGTDKFGITQKDGQFKITGIEQGIFQIRASAQGYEDELQNNIPIQNGRDVPLFFKIRKVKKHADDPTLAVESIPLVRRNPPPSYPTHARWARLEGTVWVKMQVDENGTVTEVNVARSAFTEQGKNVDIKTMSPTTSRGVGELIQSALTASRRWLFRPAMAHGKAIKTWITVPFKFSLPHRGLKNFR